MTKKHGLTIMELNRMRLNKKERRATWTNNIGRQRSKCQEDLFHYNGIDLTCWAPVKEDIRMDWVDSKLERTEICRLAEAYQEFKLAADFTDSPAHREAFRYRALYYHREFLRMLKKRITDRLAHQAGKEFLKLCMDTQRNSLTAHKLQGRTHEFHT